METLECPHCNDRFATDLADGLPDAKTWRCKRCQRSFSLGSARKFGRTGDAVPAQLIPEEQRDLLTDELLEITSPYAPSSSPYSPVPSEPVTKGDATGGVIPYKNPKALIAYYLGIFSGLPIIGFPLGIAAFILGILGLKARRENPAIKGSVHAGIGIGCGCLFTLVWGGAIAAIIVGVVSEM